MDLGFVGLGAMGQGMARVLLRAGHRLTVWNRTRERTDPLAAEGAAVAATPAEAARSGIVLSMLADDRAVEEVSSGPDGLLAGLPVGGVHVSMSTIGPDTAETLWGRHRETGRGFVSAPVFGRPNAAAAAKLAVVVAGPKEVVARVTPLLRALGPHVFVLGEAPPSANLVKLAGNFLVTAVIEALAEAMAVVGKAGIDRARFLDVLVDSLFDAPVYRTYGKLLLDERFSPPASRSRSASRTTGSCSGRARRWRCRCRSPASCATGCSRPSPPATPARTGRRSPGWCARRRGSGRRPLTGRRDPREPPRFGRRGAVPAGALAALGVALLSSARGGAAMRRIERVVLCGAGAVGALYVPLLHDLDPGMLRVLAGGERRERLRSEGLTVNGRRVDVDVVAPGEVAAPADLLLVAVKQHHLASSLEEARGVVGPETIILSLLNGITSEELLGGAFGHEKVLPAFVLGTDSVREGTHSRHSSMGRVFFGARSNDPADPRVAAVRDLFDRARIPYEIPADILREQWFKFMLNVGVNQVSALLRATYGAFATVPEARELTRAAAMEVVAISAREGVALSAADVDRVFPILAALAPGGKTSMLQDVEAGRKTEVEIFSGAVVELGRRHGVPTPVNEVLGKLLVGLERLAGVAAGA